MEGGKNAWKEKGGWKEEMIHGRGIGYTKRREGAWMREGMHKREIAHGRGRAPGRGRRWKGERVHGRADGACKGERVHRL